jgi:hypothetical protein
MYDAQNVGDAPGTIRIEAQTVLTQDLPLNCRRQRQREKLIEILTQVLDARAGPVGAPHSLVGDFTEARKVVEQLRRRDTRNLEPDIGVAPEDEKRLLAPERAAPVGHHELEIGEIDRHIVQLERIAVFGPGAGEDAGPGVDQNRQASIFRATIDPTQLLQSLRVGVGRKQLVRRMDLEATNPQTN